MKILNLSFLSIALMATTQTLHADAVRFDGGPMALDIGYGIKVNEKSTLIREVIAVNDDHLPVKIVNLSVRTPMDDRNFVYEVFYYLDVTEKVKAIELRFIPFNIWGEKDTPLSATAIEDIGIGKWSDSGKWRILSENDAIEHYAMLGYVAQVKLENGEIIRMPPELVIEEAKKFAQDFKAGDLNAKEP